MGDAHSIIPTFPSESVNAKDMHNIANIKVNNVDYSYSYGTDDWEDKFQT